MNLDYTLEISPKENPSDVKVFRFIPSIESLPIKIAYCIYETEQEKELQEFNLSTKVAKEWLVELGYDLDEYSWNPTTKQIESKALPERQVLLDSNIYRNAESEIEEI